MRKIALAGITLALLASAAVGAGAQDNPIIGKWTCDFSAEMGVIVDLELTDTEWVAYADTGMEVTKLGGTYEIAENVITFHSDEGNIEGSYDPESDEVSANYQGVLYVFQRYVEEAAEEEKK